MKTFILLLSSLFLLSSIPFGQSQMSSRPKGTFAGVYKFISETVVTNKPVREISRRNSPEWSGFYFFNDGFFSVTLECLSRKPVWVSEFPKNFDELGYESYAGRYDISNSKLSLQLETTLNPEANNQSKAFDIVMDGNLITLRKKLLPYTEDTREGELVIVLERIRVLK